VKVEPIVASKRLVWVGEPVWTLLSSSWTRPCQCCSFEWLWLAGLAGLRYHAHASVTPPVLLHSPSAVSATAGPVVMRFGWLHSWADLAYGLQCPPASGGSAAACLSSSDQFWLACSGLIESSVQFLLLELISVIGLSCPSLHWAGLPQLALWVYSPAQSLQVPYVVGFTSVQSVAGWSMISYWVWISLTWWSQWRHSWPWFHREQPVGLSCLECRWSPTGSL